MDSSFCRRCWINLSKVNDIRGTTTISSGDETCRPSRRSWRKCQSRPRIFRVPASSAIINRFRLETDLHFTARPQPPDRIHYLDIIERKHTKGLWPVEILLQAHPVLRRLRLRYQPARIALAADESFHNLVCIVTPTAFTRILSCSLVSSFLVSPIFIDIFATRATESANSHACSAIF